MDHKILLHSFCPRTAYMLYIDFVHQGAKDAQYSFEISGNTLTLNGGNATTKGVYILTKGD